MLCMVNTVGIRGCGVDTAPLFPLYINDLAGVSVKKMDAIADEESKTFEGVWDELNTRAASRFEHEVNKVQGEMYKLCRLSEVIDFGRLLEETEIVGATEWRGYTIESNPSQGSNPYYKNSALSQVFVDEISIWSKDIQAAVPIKVFDLSDGTVLYSTTKDLIAGWNDFDINTAFDALNIFVAYWGENVTTKKIQLKNSGCANGCCTAFYRSAVFDATLSTNTVVPASITYDYHSVGLSGCWSLRCSWNNLVCCAKQEFVYSWQNLLGYEFFNEITATDRLNRWSTVGKKDANVLKNEYFGYFQESLRDTLKGITINQYDCCVECDAALTVKEAHL